MNGRSRSQTWIYIFALIGVLVAIYITYGLITAGIQAYVTLIVGIMLLIGNAPELVRSLQQRTIGVALHNTLIGLALISYFVGSAILTLLFWPLAVVLLLAALPLTLNRAPIARAYLRSARNVAGQARHLLRLRQRTM